MIKIVLLACLLACIQTATADDHLLDQKLRVELIDTYNNENTHFFCSLACAMGWNREASTHLAQQAGNSYEASKLDDGSPHTAWVEGAIGDGIGEFIDFRFPRERFVEAGIGEFITLDGFWLLNGYGKDKTTWQQNGRIRKFRLYHNLALLHEIEVHDTTALQRISFPEIILHHDDTVRFEISAVYKGEKYTDTAISELIPIGAH